MMCLAKAINYNDSERKATLNVGAVVLCPGSEGFDPAVMDVFGYGTKADIIASRIVAYL